MADGKQDMYLQIFPKSMGQYMIVAELHRQYVGKQMNAKAVCEALNKIQRICDFTESWTEL